MRILTASDRALLVEAADVDEAMRLHLAWAEVPGVVERIPAARSVLVRFDPRVTSAQQLARRLTATTPDAVDEAPGAAITIPVRYDGDDLHEVAQLLGVSPAEVVQRHLDATWRVAFSGFAPGFGYLVGDDPLFDVPRRSSPRTRVPAGAVGLAGEFTGVYPRESPGGWQLIGTTDAVMWDLHREPPALLVPGTVVRFVRADRDAGGRDESGADTPDVGRSRRIGPTSGVSAPEVQPGRAPHVRATITVTRPALQLLVQDLGRPGYAQLGVSASGTADRTALHAANRAVGNAADAAVLECIGGVGLAFTGNGVAAIMGAEGEAVMTDAQGRERSIPLGIPFATFDGDVLDLGAPARGLRYVIGVRGGLLVPQELGSRATDTLSGLGPAPLVLGSVIAVGADAPKLVDPSLRPRSLPASADLVELDITFGPRDDWFTPAARAALLQQEWLVTPRSDRVGIRLQGAVPLTRAVAGELPSEGAVTGALQVPADGQPVLFLADHPLTGGYPVIGALTDASLDLAGQLPPGVRIRFRVADLSAP